MQSWELLLTTNYTPTKCSDEILDKIKKETGKDSAVDALRGYSWQYESELKKRKGHNLVPSVLRNALATLISGTEVDTTFMANYIALGNSATAPTNADLQLGNEVYRWQIGDRRSIDNIVYLDKNFGSQEVWGLTLLEVGVFVDGTEDPNSWFLLSHININETMQELENLTINITLTIS